MLLFKSTVMTTTSLMRVKPTSMSEQMSAAPLAEMGEGIKTGASGTEECLDEGIARESGVGLAGSVKDGLVNAAPTERTKRSLRLNRWFLPPSLLANMILLILLVRDGRILVDDRVVNAQANREIEAFLDLKLFRNEGGYTLSLNRTYSSEYEYCEIAYPTISCWLNGVQHYYTRERSEWTVEVYEEDNSRRLTAYWDVLDYSWSIPNGDEAGPYFWASNGKGCGEAASGSCVTSGSCFGYQLNMQQSGDRCVSVRVDTTQMWMTVSSSPVARNLDWLYSVNLYYDSDIFPEPWDHNYGFCSEITKKSGFRKAVNCRFTSNQLSRHKHLQNVDIVLGDHTDN